MPTPRTAFDIYSDSRFATGGSTRLGRLKNVLAAWDYRSVEGEDELTLEIERRSTSDFSLLTHERVVSVERYDPGVSSTFREYRLKNVTDGVTTGGELYGEVRGEWVGHADLAAGARLERIENDQSVQSHFEVYGLRSSAHLSEIILSHASSSPFKTGAPSYFSLGTVDSTRRVSMVYDFETARSAHIELAKVADQDHQVTQTSTGYRVHLRDSLGSTVEKVLVKLGRNALAAERENTSEELATRVMMRGAGEPGEEATIADNAFEVASTAGGGVLTMVDNLVLEAGQYGSTGMALYAEMPDGTLRAVTDSSTGDQLTIPGATVTPGDLVRLRRNSSGAWLTYIEKPSAVATYGVHTKLVERPDIPRIDNEAPNPFFSDWTSSLPDSWNILGALTVSENTAALYRQYGTSSLHMTGANEGEGVESAAITVAPSAARPHYTTQLAVFVVSGRVRLELWDYTDPSNPVQYPRDVANVKAVTSETGVWTFLGLAHGENHNDLATTTFRIRILADTDGTDAYLDAIQLTNTAGGADSFYDGRASNDLLLAANDELFLYAEPLDRIKVDTLDYGRLLEAGALPSSNFGFENFVLGADTVFRIPELAIESTHRIKGIRRNLLVNHEGQIEFETELERLTRELTERRRRSPFDDAPEQTRRPSCPENLSALFIGGELSLALDKGAGAAHTEFRWNVSASTDKETRWDAGNRIALTDAEQVIVDSTKSAAIASGAEIMADSVSKHGLYSRCWSTAKPKFLGSPVTCINLGPSDSSTEYNSTCSTSTSVSFHTYNLVSLPTMGLSSGDEVSYGYAGRIVNCASTGAGSITDYEAVVHHHSVGAARGIRGVLVNGVSTFGTPFVAGGFSTWLTGWLWVRPTPGSTATNYSLSGSLNSDASQFSITLSSNIGDFGWPAIGAFTRLSGSSTKPAKFRNFRVMHDRRLYWTGKVGGIAELRVVRQAGEFAANAAVSTSTSFNPGFRYPGIRVQARSATGGVLHTEAPSSGIWGGDKWSFSTSTASTSGFVATNTRPGLIHRQTFVSSTFGGNWHIVGSPDIVATEARFRGGDRAVYIGSTTYNEMYLQAQAWYDNQDAPRPALFTRVQGINVVDCFAAIDLEYLDANSSVISSVASSGLRGSNYARTCVRSTIPASAEFARWTAKKKGTSECEAYVKELQFNLGPTCCVPSPPFLPGIPGTSGPSTRFNGLAISFSTVTPCSTGGGMDVVAQWNYSGSTQNVSNTVVNLFYYEGLLNEKAGVYFIPGWVLRHSTAGIAISTGSTVAGIGSHTVSFSSYGSGATIGLPLSSAPDAWTTGDIKNQWYVAAVARQFNVTVGQGQSPAQNSLEAYGRCST